MEIDSSETENKDSVMHCKLCPGDPEKSTGLRKFRARLHLTLEQPDYSTTAKIVSVVIMLSIVASTFAFVASTVEDLKDTPVWDELEKVVVSLFTIEYVLRLLACSKPIKFVFEILNIVDLLAIAPFYISLGQSADEESEGGSTLKVIRVVRLARVFRLFKMSRYSTYMQIMGRALRRSVDAFGLLLFFVGVAVIIFSSLMYYAERGERAENGIYYRSDGSESPFTSIPATFYWCIITMTTVGYGDIVPVEDLGKFIAAITMVCGILVIALPVTILGSNFQDVYAVHKRINVKTDIPTGTANLKVHIHNIRKHRIRVDQIMKQLRFLLQKRSKDTDFFQIWSSLDFVVSNGLLRVEDFLSEIDIPKINQDRRDTFRSHPGRLSRTLSEVFTPVSNATGGRSPLLWRQNTGRINSDSTRTPLEMHTLQENQERQEQNTTHCHPNSELDSSAALLSEAEKPEQLVAANP
eukprot:CAMPEP_0175123586 /NCGR_PEP_ID=MMETSP0087-20121206/2325_1 /TAXON_ID=136419 /ORGANISM="Unknown Unknown, Strain D1" /LENGTH=466 /DNA_ID=CAMNT_0016405293 /DNA_START=122 /DNA_END=1522 /DNA_ORIENTATION=-